MRDVVVSAVGALLLVGCAQARTGQAPDADVGQGDDAKVWRDGAIEGPVDARPDSPAVLPPTDAGCTNMAVQLLANPLFDVDANGTGWVQQPIVSTYPLITGADGNNGTFIEHSAPYKVWMGGFTGDELAVPSVTDTLYQDVAIPAGTTQLVLTGQYDVRTSEIGSTVYDTGSVALTQTNGTLIETALAVSNITPKTAWTPFSKTFSTTQAGQTVRLRLTTTNDDSFVTSYFFDTFALTATVCQ